LTQGYTAHSSYRINHIRSWYAAATWPELWKSIKSFKKVLSSKTDKEANAATSEEEKKS
jgi:hypothetical protein